MHHPTKRTLRFALIALFTLSTVLLAFIGAQYISENQSAQDIVEQFGFVGVVTLGFIGGLNLFVPVPAATLTPLFLASGFSISTVIVALTIGTTIADVLSYGIGYYGKNTIGDRYPRILRRVIEFRKKHKNYIVPGVFLYSALIPFPNEAILIPLGLSGIKLRTLLVPVILGTLVSQTLLAYGFTEVFEWLF